MAGRQPVDRQLAALRRSVGALITLWESTAAADAAVQAAQGPASQARLLHLSGSVGDLQLKNSTTKPKPKGRDQGLGKQIPCLQRLAAQLLHKVLVAQGQQVRAIHGLWGRPAGQEGLAIVGDSHAAGQASLPPRAPAAAAVRGGRRAPAGGPPTARQHPAHTFSLTFSLKAGTRECSSSLARYSATSPTLHPSTSPARAAGCVSIQRGSQRQCCSLPAARSKPACPSGPNAPIWQPGAAGASLDIGRLSCLVWLQPTLKKRPALRWTWDALP